MNYSGYHQPDVPKVWTHRRCRSFTCDSHRVASSVWSGAQKDLSKHTWQSGCGDASDAWQESPSISKYLLFLYIIGFPGVAVFTTSNMLTIPPCVHSKAISWRIEGTDQNTMIRSLHRNEFMPAIHHDTSWYYFYFFFKKIILRYRPCVFPYFRTWILGRNNFQLKASGFVT